MEFQKKNVKYMCSFYASEWHLAVMLLPYISKQIEKGIKFDTILKEEIAKNVKELISKLNLNKKIEEKMLDINWNLNKINTQEEINKFMNDKIKSEKSISIIINGTNKEVEDTYDLINNWLTKNLKIINENNIEITIISCFKALEIKENINNIINEYDFALNTSGEHKIEEIYNMYKKVISY